MILEVKLLRTAKKGYANEQETTSDVSPSVFSASLLRQIPVDFDDNLSLERLSTRRFQSPK